MDMEARLTSLEKRVRTLEGSRPGRKILPIVVSEEGVCGVDPERDSSLCTDASVYRRQKGCKGISCKAKAREYHVEYQARIKNGS